MSIVFVVDAFVYRAEECGMCAGFTASRRHVSQTALHRSLSAQRKLNGFYRPHPKDGEGNVFSLSTPGGGYPARSSWGGGVPCQVQPGGGGVTCQVQLGGVPWPGGVPCQVQPGGVPWPRGDTLPGPAGGVPR